MTFTAPTFVIDVTHPESPATVFFKEDHQTKSFNVESASDMAQVDRILDSSRDSSFKRAAQSVYHPKAKPEESDWKALIKQHIEVRQFDPRDTSPEFEISTRRTRGSKINRSSDQTIDQAADSAYHTLEFVETPPSNWDSSRIAVYCEREEGYFIRSIPLASATLKAYVLNDQTIADLRKRADLFQSWSKIKNNFQNDYAFEHERFRSKQTEPQIGPARSTEDGQVRPSQDTQPSHTQLSLDGPAVQERNWV